MRQRNLRCGLREHTASAAASSNFGILFWQGPGLKDSVVFLGTSAFGLMGLPQERLLDSVSRSGAREWAPQFGPPVGTPDEMQSRLV